MFESHWKLTERPFENWGDESYFFPADTHQAALLQMEFAIRSRRSAVMLCGDSGMGKTMLIDRLVQQLEEDVSPVAQIRFPHLDGEQLLGYVADELCGELGPANEPMRLTLRRLTQFLQKNTEAGKQALIIVDEAQVLQHVEQLETLRLLLNLHRDSSRAESSITLLLSGQSTLLSLVERQRAFDDRVSCKCILNRFTVEETQAYLRHRLEAAGGELEAIFSPRAVEVIHLRSAGIPRRINRIADLALMVGYAEDVTRIDVQHIENVHQELMVA